MDEDHCYDWVSRETSSFIQKMTKKERDIILSAAKRNKKEDEWNDIYETDVMLFEYKGTLEEYKIEEIVKIVMLDVYKKLYPNKSDK